MKYKYLYALSIIGLSLSLAACKSEPAKGPAEQAGEKVDEAAEDTKEAVDEAAHDTERAVEDAKD